MNTNTRIFIGIFVTICLFKEFGTAVPSPQLDVLVILDSHSGVGFGDWMVEKQFAGDILSSFSSIGPCDVKVAVMNYGSEAVVNWNFDSPNAMDRTKLMQSVSEIEMVGGEMGSLVSVLNMAAENVFGNNKDRPNVPNLVILINSMESETNGLAEAAKKLKDIAIVMVIGVTNAVNLPQLETIASKDLVFSVNDFGLIQDVLQKSLLTTECDANCLKGFSNKNINFVSGSQFYNIILKKKTKEISFDLNDLLKPEESLKVSKKNVICIDATNGALFYVSKVCLTTKHVKKVYFRGYDDEGNLVWKTAGNTNGCKEFKIKKKTLKTLDSFCISFNPTKGYSNDMRVGEFAMNGCADKS